MDLLNNISWSAFLLVAIPAFLIYNAWVWFHSESKFDNSKGKGGDKSDGSVDDGELLDVADEVTSVTEEVEEPVRAEIPPAPPAEQQRSPAEAETVREVEASCEPEDVDDKGSVFVELDSDDIPDEVKMEEIEDGFANLEYRVAVEDGGGEIEYMTVDSLPGSGDEEVLLSAIDVREVDEDGLTMEERVALGISECYGDDPGSCEGDVAEPADDASGGGDVDPERAQSDFAAAANGYNKGRVGSVANGDTEEESKQDIEEEENKQGDEPEPVGGEGSDSPQDCQPVDGGGGDPRYKDEFD